jgi:hypothetical protein
MIVDGFDERTKTTLEMAMATACQRLGANGVYREARNFVAGKLLDCAHSGKLTSGALTEAGIAAAVELNAVIAAHRRTNFSND